MGAGCSARPAATYKVSEPSVLEALKEDQEIDFNSEVSTASNASPSVLWNSDSTDTSESWGEDGDTVFCQSVGSEIASHGHVVMSSVCWKLNPVFSASQYVKPGAAKELPASASKLKAWIRSKWSLHEDNDGLKLQCTIKKAQQPSIFLLPWRSERRQTFEVHLLRDLHLCEGNLGDFEPLDCEVQLLHSELPSRSSSKTFERSVSEQPDMTATRSIAFSETLTEEFPIPEVKNLHNSQIQVLYPFVVQWTDLSRHGKNCRVIGCESEEDRREWTSRLKAYVNIEKRSLVARVWMRRRCLDAGDTEPVIEEPMRDIRGWKRRLVMLDLMREPPALCITYVSTKTDVSERIECVLASSTRGEVAEVRQIPARMDVVATELQHKDTVLHTAQYDIATTCCKDFAMQIPRQLSVLEIKQHDESMGGRENCMLGFEDDGECRLWLQRIKAETSSLCMHSRK